MKNFKDTAGRTWNLAINVTAIKRVRDLLAIDLTKILDGPLLADLAADPVQLVDVLYVLCREQAEEQQVSDALFGAAMSGDALDGATTAFLEELVDFFPAGRRALLQKTLSKLHNLEQKALDHATAVIDSDRIDQALSQELAQADERLTERLQAGLSSTSGN